MKKSIILTIIGVALLAIGGGLILQTAQEGILRSLPYICIGLGCGLFGQGVGEIASISAKKRNPEEANRIDIEQNDERNIAIANQSKAKAFDAMLYMYGVLWIIFALIGVEVPVILSLVTVYLVVVGIHVYYLMKYQKTM